MDDPFTYEKLRPTLWLACKNGLEVDVKNLLLDPNMDIEERGGRYNTTPLMVASQNNFTNIVQLLVDAGADTSARDMRGMTAFHLAKSESHLPTMNILLDHGSDEMMTPGWPEMGCKRNTRHLWL